ncbi:16S rRNA (guanine(527)-N(7))-methyltransferase RsmG [Microlunatus sp. Y2014]|uniref:16S rRNA (guanine(527)-N(7))-methyltransferase RsmG n=1 Tax=Microlunatus sp. Y2014 TaxID=3418488 RepID=UPI003DA7252B
MTGTEPGDIGRRVFGDRLPQAKAYADRLATVGIERGLLGPREAERVWDRHVLNSVAVAGLLPEGASVADIGSGAGLPGIPLAILRPDLTVTLVEPLLRRSTFLTETVAELGLGERVRVERARAEELEERFDVVVSRALAPLDRLAGWCRPLVAAGGMVLAIKGRSAADEVSSHEATLRKLGLTADVLTVTADPDLEPTYAVRLVTT